MRRYLRLSIVLAAMLAGTVLCAPARAGNASGSIAVDENFTVCAAATFASEQVAIVGNITATGVYGASYGIERPNPVVRFPTESTSGTHIEMCADGNGPRFHDYGAVVYVFQATGITDPRLRQVATPATTVTISTTCRELERVGMPMVCTNPVVVVAP
jgi:hypothetical protein